jgi:hypothetical protein
MATVTLSSADRNQPEAVHTGDNVAICRISLSVTSSLDSTWRIGKLPHGAIPLDAIFYPGAAAPAGFVTRFGVSASTELFFASDSWAEAAGTNYRTARQLGTARQISLSDDAMPRFEYITMGGGVAIGITVGHMGDLIVYYKMPGQNL